MEAVRLTKMGYYFKLGGSLLNKNKNPKRWTKVSQNKILLWGGGGSTV